MRLQKWFPVLLIGALFIAWSVYFILESSFVAADGARRFCLFDDSMISMRYAWNLVHGDGLVWNAGERVEGVTNLGMTLLMALCISAFGKVGGILAVQILGVCFLLAAGFFAVKIGEALLENSGLGDSGFAPALFFGCALAYYPLCYWSLMGMEMGLVSALICAGVWLAFRAERTHRLSLALPVLLGLAFVTRPDTAVPSMLIMLFRLYTLRRNTRWLRNILIESALLAAFVAGVSLFRWSYYGSLTPNTYLLKMVGLTLPERIENGLGFLSPFWSSMVLPVGFGLLATVLGFNRRTVLLFGLFISSVAYEIYVGGDPWTYWRKIAPFVPLLLILIVSETAILLNARISSSPLAKLTLLRWAPPLEFIEGAVMGGVLLFVSLQINDRFKDEITFEKPPYTASNNENHVKVGMALKKLTKKSASVGVTWAGTIPYYAERAGIDFLGKSDKYIASRAPDTRGGVAWRGMKSVPGHNKYDLHYSIEKRRPTYVQTAKWGKHNLSRYVNTHYRSVRFEGATLRLLKGSPDVHWNMLP